MARAGPVVVAEASNLVEASIWVDALRAAGIEASWFERSEAAAVGGGMHTGWATYPVLVDRESLSAARSVIAEMAGGLPLAPYPDDERSSRDTRILVVAGTAIVVGALVLLMVTRLAEG